MQGIWIFLIMEYSLKTLHDPAGCAIMSGRGEREKNAMQNKQNLQDTFLNQARRERQLVTVFLMNGFQLRGIVRGFDSFAVLVDCEGKQELIYKHAISTLIPTRNIDLALNSGAEREE